MWRRLNENYSEDWLKLKLAAKNKPPSKRSNPVYLINLTDPAVNAIEWPAISDVIHKQDSLLWQKVKQEMRYKPIKI